MTIKFFNALRKHFAHPTTIKEKNIKLSLGEIVIAGIAGLALAPLLILPGIGAFYGITYILKQRHVKQADAAAHSLVEGVRDNILGGGGSPLNGIKNNADIARVRVEYLRERARALEGKSKDLLESSSSGENLREDPISIEMPQLTSNEALARTITLKGKGKDLLESSSSGIATKMPELSRIVFTEGEGEGDVSSHEPTSFDENLTLTTLRKGWFSQEAILVNAFQTEKDTLASEDPTDIQKNHESKAIIRAFLPFMTFVDIMKFLGQYPKLADVKLVLVNPDDDADERTLPFSQFLLMEKSEFFNTMFSSMWHTPGENLYTIKESADNFIFLLNAAFSPTINSYAEDIIKLAFLADKFQFYDVVRLCRVWITTSMRQLEREAKISFITMPAYRDLFEDDFQALLQPFTKMKFDDEMLIHFLNQSPVLDFSEYHLDKRRLQYILKYIQKNNTIVSVKFSPYTLVNAEHLETLAEIAPNLHTLDLPNCTNVLDFSFLQKLPNTRTLSIGQPSDNHNLGESLAHLHLLETLEFKPSRYQAFNFLKEMPDNNLKHFILNTACLACLRLSNHLQPHFFPDNVLLPKIRRLEIVKSPTQDGSPFTLCTSELKIFPNLQTLLCDFVIIDEPDVLLPHLKKVFLSPRVPPFDFSWLDGCKDLENVIIDCRYLPECARQSSDYLHLDILQELAKHAPNIRSLKLTGVKGRLDIEYLRNLQKLSHLKISADNGTTCLLNLTEFDTMLPLLTLELHNVYLQSWSILKRSHQTLKSFKYTGGGRLKFHAIDCVMPLVEHLELRLASKDLADDFYKVNGQFFPRIISSPAKK